MCLRDKSTTCGGDLGVGFNASLEFHSVQFLSPRLKMQRSTHTHSDIIWIVLRIKLYYARLEPLLVGIPGKQIHATRCEEETNFPFVNSGRS